MIVRVATLQVQSLTHAQNALVFGSGSQLLDTVQQDGRLPLMLTLTAARFYLA